MKFPNTLVKGTLVKRYKRFLADVELPSGEIVVAHCANPGSMMGLKEPGYTVYMSPSEAGKLDYRWEIVDADGTLVGINTSWPNKIVEEALNEARIPELAGYESLRREVKYGENSRIDFLLQSDGKPDCYVEVKNVTLRRGDLAEFPDSVTARGTKHLLELEKMVQAGHRAVMLYVVQRQDCTSFALAADIDPDYAKTSKGVFATGVEKLCYQCDVNLDGVSIEKPLAFVS